MLKIEKKVVTAVCDACGKDLRYWMSEGPDARCNVNYGELRPDFGYGSDLDPMGGQIVPHYQLCEGCFAKAVNAVGLPVGDFDPVICPLCRKGRNGKDDHPECMKDWYPHPDSDSQKELRKHMEEREKAFEERKKESGEVEPS